MQRLAPALRAANAHALVPRRSLPCPPSQRPVRAVKWPAADWPAADRPADRPAADQCQLPGPAADQCQLPWRPAAGSLAGAAADERSGAAAVDRAAANLLCGRGKRACERRVAKRAAGRTANRWPLRLGRGHVGERKQGEQELTRSRATVGDLCAHN